MSLSDLRTALAVNLSAIEGVQVSPFVLSQPSPPTIQLLAPGPIQYDLAMGRGLDVDTITIQAFVDFADGEVAQRLMDEFAEAAGSNSIKTAAESDKTLGGWADDMHVTVCGGVSLAVVAGMDVLLAEWTVEIYAKGTV